MSKSDDAQLDGRNPHKTFLYHGPPDPMYIKDGQPKGCHAERSEATPRRPLRCSARPETYPYKSPRGVANVTNIIHLPLGAPLVGFLRNSTGAPFLTRAPPFKGAPIIKVMLLIKNICIKYASNRSICCF